MGASASITPRTLAGFMGGLLEGKVRKGKGLKGKEGIEGREGR